MIYEILYIIPSKFSETEIEGVMARVQKMLEDAGAKVQDTKNLGKIKLAYPIKTVTHGTYVLTYVQYEGDNLKKIDQDLRLSEDILRHVMLKRPSGIPSAPYTLTSYQEPLSPEGKRTTIKKEPKQKNVIQQDIELKTDKMTAGDLDKQLDQILDSDLTNI